MQKENEPIKSILNDTSKLYSHLEGKFSEIKTMVVFKLPIIDNNGKVVQIFEMPGYELPNILCIEKNFYIRDFSNMYRPASAYIAMKRAFYSEDGTVTNMK